MDDSLLTLREKTIFFSLVAALMLWNAIPRLLRGDRQFAIDIFAGLVVGLVLGVFELGVRAYSRTEEVDRGRPS